jgi:hypothetical protein
LLRNYFYGTMTLNAQCSTSAHFESSLRVSVDLQPTVLNHLTPSNSSLSGLVDSLQCTHQLSRTGIKTAFDNARQVTRSFWVALFFTVRYSVYAAFKPRRLFIFVNILAVILAGLSISNLWAGSKYSLIPLIRQDVTGTEAGLSKSPISSSSVSNDVRGFNSTSQAPEFNFLVPSTQSIASSVLTQTQGLKLSKESLRVVQFFAKKYHLASSQLETYIYYAEKSAKAKNIDPSLILAVMSIESGMNPIVESPVGAQGLMQVLTSVHADKYKPFGGTKHAFDVDANIAVGSAILADCIKLAGNVELGLKYYVGATGPTDNGYAAKVWAEKDRIEKARAGTFDFSSGNRYTPLNTIAVSAVSVVPPPPLTANVAVAIVATPKSAVLEAANSFGSSLSWPVHVTKEPVVNVVAKSLTISPNPVVTTVNQDAKPSASTAKMEPVSDKSVVQNHLSSDLVIPYKMDIK